jgi:hypothetical protein
VAERSLLADGVRAVAKLPVNSVVQRVRRAFALTVHPKPPILVRVFLAQCWKQPMCRWIEEETRHHADPN